MWQCCFSLSLEFQKRLHRGERKKKKKHYFFFSVLCSPLWWSLRMPLTWWSCSAPFSPARRSLSGTATRRASSPARRPSLPRTATRRGCPMGMAAQPSPCVWPSPPRRQKPCRPLWPSAALKKPSPSPARTWPATCARSSGTWSTRGSSAPWPHRAAPPERSAAWRRCAPSAPSVHLRVQKSDFKRPRAPGWTGSKPSEPWWAIWEETPRLLRARKTNWRRAEGMWTARRAGEAALGETELKVAEKQR